LQNLLKQLSKSFRTRVLQKHKKLLHFFHAKLETDFFRVVGPQHISGDYVF